MMILILVMVMMIIIRITTMAMTTTCSAMLIGSQCSDCYSLTPIMIIPTMNLNLLQFFKLPLSALFPTNDSPVSPFFFKARPDFQDGKHKNGRNFRYFLDLFNQKRGCHSCEIRGGFHLLARCHIKMMA